MKAKEAHKLLEQYSGEELYRKACQLFRDETENLIALRSHGKKPSNGDIFSAVKQMREWFRKVAEGLAWRDPKLPKNIIQWETSAIYIKYGILDPEIEAYRDRARKAMLKGKPLPLLEALTQGALDAVSGMMLAQLSQSAKRWLELDEKRKTFAKEHFNKRTCFYTIDERFCPYQETYSMVGKMPTCVEGLVFVCIIDKCIKE